MQGFFGGGAGLNRDVYFDQILNKLPSGIDQIAINPCYSHYLEMWNFQM